MKIGSSPNVSWIISSVSSDQFSRSVVSDSLRPHGRQHARPSPSITSSQSLLKLMSIEPVMSSNRTLIIQHSQIFSKWIHNWIKMVSVWKGDHKCLVWDSFPSPILDEPGLLQSCRLVWGHPLSGGFIFKSSLELSGLWVLVSTSPFTSTGFHHLKPRKDTWESVSLKTLQRFLYKIPTSLSCYFQNSSWGKKKKILIPYL